MASSIHRKKLFFVLIKVIYHSCKRILIQNESIPQIRISATNECKSANSNSEMYHIIFLVAV